MQDGENLFDFARNLLINKSFNFCNLLNNLIFEQSVTLIIFNIISAWNYCIGIAFARFKTRVIETFVHRSRT